MVQYVLVRRDLQSDLGWPMGSVIAQGYVGEPFCNAPALLSAPCATSYAYARHFDHLQMSCSLEAALGIEGA